MDARRKADSACCLDCSKISLGVDGGGGGCSDGAASTVEFTLVVVFLGLLLLLLRALRGVFL